MSQRLSQQQIFELKVESPSLEAPVRAVVDRNFGLPTALYAATVALYLAFIGVMAALFLNPELTIPMAIFAGFVVFAFGLAGWWVKMTPANDSAPPSWAQFRAQGIETPSGWLTAREATVQVLLLPVLILGWGLGVSLVVAFT